MSAHAVSTDERRSAGAPRLGRIDECIVPDDVAVNITAPVKTASEPPVLALKVAPLRAVTARGEDVSIAQVVEAPPLQVARLPKTAGNLPLFGLMGLLSMAVGFSLKRFGNC